MISPLYTHNMPGLCYRWFHSTFFWGKIRSLYFKGGGMMLLEYQHRMMNAFTYSNI